MCSECKHQNKEKTEEPCKDCPIIHAGYVYYSNFEPKETGNADKIQQV